MSPFLVATLLIIGLLIAAGLYRVWAGPTVFDRLVAIALVSVNGVIVLVILGFVLDRAALFLDIALAYALLAFLLPIALGRYFEERDDGMSTDGLPSPRRAPKPTGVIPHGLLAERGRRETAQRAIEARRRHQEASYPHGEVTPPPSIGPTPPRPDHEPEDHDDTTDDQPDEGGRT